jgi:single-strand DNA-binding protein
MNLNKAIVIGNLTRDPELKALPSGLSVTTFSLATNRVWKDKDGQKKEDAEFHNIIVFGKQAESVAQFLRKGSSALVEGRIQTRSWEKPDGTKAYRTEIVSENIQFGSRPKAEEQPVAPKTDTPKAEEGIEYPEENINVDDIPF